MPHRQFWLNRYAQDFIRNELPGVPPDLDATAPIGQVAGLLSQFIAGDPLKLPPQSYGFADLHVMRPEEDGVWNARTIDVRMYGWFIARDVFLCVNIVPKARIIKFRVNEDVIQAEVVRARSKLPAPLQVYEHGNGYSDVLSDRP